MQDRASPPQLSAACQALLKQWGLLAVGADNPGLASVRDADGAWQFDITVGIDVADLKALLRFAQGRYSLGRSDGRATLQAEFHALMGGAPATK